MIVLRHRYHYGSLVVSEKGALNGSSIVNDQIPAILRNGEYAYKPYRGVLNDVGLINIQLVKLVNLTDYTYDPDGFNGWIRIPNKHYVVGVFLHGGYYLLLKHDRPQIHAL
ncbi:hypothetical protein [Vibrio harveyi]|uniref:hypothetical protein n=1 Tax=Vibrio harveyi TaxID=669 RepID=UPI0024809E12|nr:hypothetical protein [Vibrio harveyi]